MFFHGRSVRRSVDRTDVKARYREASAPKNLKPEKGTQRMKRKTKVCTKKLRGFFSFEKEASQLCNLSKSKQGPQLSKGSGEILKDLT